jgi:phosphoglycolate phosphatase
LKRLIVYDLDGTLVDTLEDITQAANHMLRQMGAPLRLPSEVRAAIGLGASQLVKACLNTDDPELIERGLGIYRAYYGEHFLDHSALYPGARETLEYFKSRRQAVITNKPNPFSRELLSGLGVASYFLDIVGGDSNYPRKPDPAALCAMMRVAEIRPSETLLVGDSPIDVETGRNAGVFTVALAHGFSDIDELSASCPDTIVGNFKELLALAQKQGW